MRISREGIGSVAMKYMQQAGKNHCLCRRQRFDPGRKIVSCTKDLSESVLVKIVRQLSIKAKAFVFFKLCLNGGALFFPCDIRM